MIPSIASDFGVSQFIAAKIVWLYMLPYGAAALLYGPLARAYEARMVELVCLFFFSLANLLAALSKDIIVLFWARSLMGAFGASVIPLALILIAGQAEQGERGRAVGIFFGSTFIASLLGLFLSGIVHWRMIFFLPAYSGFLLWLCMYRFLPNLKGESAGLKFNYLAALREKKVALIFIYIFLVSLFYHGVQQWLAVYFSRSFDFSQFLISALITLTSLSGVFGEILGGWFADKAGRLKTAGLGLALMIASVFFLVFKSPFVVLAVLMIVWGLGWTFNHAGVSTILTDLPKRFINEAAGLNSGVRFVSGGLGAMLGGLLMRESFTFGFLALGFCLIVLMLFAKALLGDRVLRQEEVVAQ